MTELLPAPGAEAQLAAVRAELAQLRKEVDAALDAAIDGLLPSVAGLFEPGHTYALHLARFACVVVTTDPTSGDPVAWGWSTFNTGKAPCAHRAMTTRDYKRWMDNGAKDLGPDNTLGDPE